MNIKPVRNDEDLRAAFQRLESVFQAPEGTPEADEMEVLVTLIEAYEHKHYPISAADPIDAIKFRMEQQGLTQALDGLMGLFRDRVLPFDTDAARRYAELAVTANVAGRGFPTPDGYIAAISASRRFIVASRDSAPYEAASVTVINPWQA